MEQFIWPGVAAIEAVIVLVLVARCLRYEDRLAEIGSRICSSYCELLDLRSALRKIRDLETPSAAHAAKRMAKVAREALQ